MFGLSRTMPQRLYKLAQSSVLALAVVLSACKDEKSGNEPAERPMVATSDAVTSNASPVLALEPARRGDILAAVSAAADAIASGRPLPQSNLALTDRNFDVRLPFGCADLPAPGSGQWSIDTESNILRATFKPEHWTNDPRFQSLVDGPLPDAVEGFWIDRPWTTVEECPAQPEGPKAMGTAPAEMPLIAPQSVAIAQFFDASSSRITQRRNRPYTYTGQVPPSVRAPGASMQLHLSGRVSGFADGQPIHCLAQNPWIPPLCVLAVELDSAAFKLSGSDESLVEWKY
jgi:hypothetical protein